MDRVKQRDRVCRVCGIAVSVDFIRESLCDRCAADTCFYVDQSCFLQLLIIGTVKGDLHDIGKNLVIMMAEGAGYEVVDLGVDVSADQYIAAINEHNAKLLGMSALLTTTMGYMATVIQELENAGLVDVKTCIGGAPVTQAFADEIDADGYATDAANAVSLFNTVHHN